MSVVEMLLLMNAENVMEIMPHVQAVQILMQTTLIQMQLFHVMIAVNILIMMDWLLSIVEPLKVPRSVVDATSLRRLATVIFLLE